MVWLGAVLGLRWGEGAGLRVARIDSPSTVSTHQPRTTPRKPMCHKSAMESRSQGPYPALTCPFESGRGDLNPRPQRPERCALTKLRYFPATEMLPDLSDADAGTTVTGFGLYDSS